VGLGSSLATHWGEAPSPGSGWAPQLGAGMQSGAHQAAPAKAQDKPRPRPAGQQATRAVPGIQGMAWRFMFKRCHAIRMGPWRWAQMSKSLTGWQV